MNKLTGLLGIIILLSIAFTLSNNRSKINIRILLWGLGLQWIFAIFILKTPFGKPIFGFFDKAVNKLIGRRSKKKLVPVNLTLISQHGYGVDEN